VLLAFTVGIVGCGWDAIADGSGRTATFSVEHRLASELDPSAPTTVGIVTFSVDGKRLTSASIEFGLHTNYDMRAPVDLSEPNHRTLLLGMKPARQYHYRVVASDESETYVSDDHVIETGAPMTLISLRAFEVKDDDARERGFIIVSFRSSGDAIAIILDADGEIVWWYSRATHGIANAVISADGKNMWLVAPNSTGLPVQRVTMDGLEEQTYPLTHGSHDITSVTGSTMAFLDYGEGDCESIFEIDPSGVTTEVFESEGLVDPNAGRVGCHGNALRYWPDFDGYSFSDRHQDILFSSRTDGSLLWRLSDRVEGGNVAWGEEQHGHHLADDRLLVFANAGGGPRRSAVVEYTTEGEETFRYVGGLYTQHMGDVQRLPGGNLLVTYSNASIIQELDAEQNVVLEIDGADKIFGYTEWTDTLYPR
jgi:hypothetical protein